MWYEEVIKPGRSFLAKPYLSKSGEPLNVMKCIDIYHSQDLELLTRKYVKK